MSTYESAVCPMAGCDADLYITTTLNRPVFLDDTAEELRDLDGAYSQSWTIGCTEGHVVLLPVSHAGDSEIFGACAEDDCDHQDLARLHALIGHEQAVSR